MATRSVRDLDVAGKRVLVRVDFNVPLTPEGAVGDDTRLRASLPTIQYLLENGASVILMSHLGRPKGGPDPKLSLAPVAVHLADLLGKPVQFAADCVGTETLARGRALQPGQGLLLENLRFHPGEEQNDPHFAAALAALADVYVNDAFGAAHRAHASTEGVAHLLPSYAGRLLQREVETLEGILSEPARPLVAGAKPATR